MPGDNWGLWGTFVLVGLCTLLPRSSFIVAGQQIRLPAGLQHALRYAPAAALAALIAPDLLLVSGGLQPFNPKLAAAVAVVGAVSLSRNPWLPFIAGMLVLTGARLFA